MVLGASAKISRITSADHRVLSLLAMTAVQFGLVALSRTVIGRILGTGHLAESNLSKYVHSMRTVAHLTTQAKALPFTMQPVVAMLSNALKRLSIESVIIAPL